MLCVFLLEIITSLLFIKYVIVSDTGSYNLAAVALSATTHPDTELGLATKKFMDDLKSVGLKPVLIQKIKRAPLSVKGALISLSGDNIQVFEYPDNETASKEMTIFAGKYTKSTASNLGENTTHLYIRDKIVIFYMGTEKNILVTLNKDMNNLSLNNK